MQFVIKLSKWQEISNCQQSIDALFKLIGQQPAECDKKALQEYIVTFKELFYGCALHQVWRREVGNERSKRLARNQTTGLDAFMLHSTLLTNQRNSVTESAYSN